MSEAQNILSKKRKELSEQEERILNDLESSAADLTKTVDKTLKNSLLIGTGLLAGYAIYKLLANGDGGKNKEKKLGKVKPSKGRSSVNPLIALAAQKGLSMLIDVLKSNIKK